MIAGVILARNAELNIAQCVEALRAHADEVILIDADSDDRTVELAKPLVDKILSAADVPGIEACTSLFQENRPSEPASEPTEPLGISARLDFIDAPAEAWTL